MGMYYCSRYLIGPKKIPEQTSSSICMSYMWIGSLRSDRSKNGSAWVGDLQCLLVIGPSFTTKNEEISLSPWT